MLGDPARRTSGYLLSTLLPSVEVLDLCDWISNGGGGDLPPSSYKSRGLDLEVEKEDMCWTLVVYTPQRWGREIPVHLHLLRRTTILDRDAQLARDSTGPCSASTRRI